MPDYSSNWSARSSAKQVGTKVSMLQLVHPKVVQPKSGAHGLKSALLGCSWTACLHLPELTGGPYLSVLPTRQDSTQGQ